MTYMHISGHHKQSGFTLVELAIALAVIGILLATLLKVNEMILNAQITKTIQQVQEVESATKLFVDRYGDFPGNILNANLQLPNCTATYCTNRYTTIANIIVSAEDANRFWLQLDRSGLFKGVQEKSSTSILSPINALGGLFTMTFRVLSSDYYSVMLISDNLSDARISPVIGQALDVKLDDSRPNTGIMRMVNSPTACIGSIPSRYGADSNARCELQYVMPSINAKNL